MQRCLGVHAFPSHTHGSHRHSSARTLTHALAQVMKQDMELRNIQQIEERKYQVEIMRLKTEVEELKRGSAAAPALPSVSREGRDRHVGIGCGCEREGGWKCTMWSRITREAWQHSTAYLITDPPDP